MRSVGVGKILGVALREGGIGVGGDDNAGTLARAERDQLPRSHLCAVLEGYGQLVGERAIQRHGKADVGESCGRIRYVRRYPSSLPESYVNKRNK